MNINMNMSNVNIYINIYINYTYPISIISNINTKYDTVRFLLLACSYWY